MPANLVITVISDDKPGIVKQLATTVAEFGGNWLESRLSHLAGKFAGVIRVSADPAQLEQLEAALANLVSQHIRVSMEESSDAPSKGMVRQATFTALGPDRAGIVKEIAQAFTEYNINVEELSTNCSSMPYSGDPLFEAEGVLHLSDTTDLDRLTEQLELIADNLAIDIRITEVSSTASA